MTNFNVIEEKISSIQKYLKILNRFKKYSQKEIEENDILKGALERYLYLIAQEAISLAEAIISLRDFRRPGDYSESFYILNEESAISLPLAKKMAGMVGFRNVIAHDYKKLNFDVVYNVLQNELQDINYFVKEVKKFLNI